MRSLFLIFCFGMLWCFLIFSSSFVHAAEISSSQASSFIDQMFSLYNAQNDKALFKDHCTSRFSMSSEFSVFQETMMDIRKSLGTVSSKKEMYSLQDHYWKENFHFYRGAFTVRHQKGEARHYFVVLIEKGRLLIDGWAVFANDRFLLSQGNLYNMPFEKAGQVALLSVIPDKTLKDNKTDYLKKETLKDVQKSFLDNRPAFETVLNGDYKTAKAMLLERRDDFAVKVLEDLEKGIVKSDIVQGIFTVLLKIGELDWVNAKKQLDLVWEKDDHYWASYPLAMAIEGNTTKSAAKIRLYQNRLFEVIDPAKVCKTEKKEGRDIEHCRIEGYFPGILDLSMAGGQLDGVFQVFDKNGNIQVRLNYKSGAPDGRQEFYFPSGKLSGWQEYENNSLKASKVFNESGDLVYEVQAP